ncbi:kinesin-like protein KIN-7O isoform X2 [Coffea arabica]|uniref:Kinesin-like protein KIN-7O isoform X2 n=1 Tax=Coffea arabica TaxID=13443 RepID=A0ABM4URK8_COFAR
MERIHVSVRARPLSPEDAKNSPWRISGNSIFLPNQTSCKFEFDRVFEEKCKTAEVYLARTKDLVAAAVRGFNGTVFAYGQTSSGKTHTMRGSASEPGVIPLAVYDLFKTIHEEVDREFLLRMSYMEIYNEEINDLLAPEHRKLQIHESIERGIFVAGLREEIVASTEQVLGLMEFGESHRHIGETNMNVYSSRSHTIFRMIIESREKNEDADSDNTCDAVRVSVLNLVDLAGSERAAKTGAEGVRLKEGSHINKSLMTLGTVIKKLSEGVESQGGHVPYRDSKLTRILQPALGGNANTAIICNITLAQILTDAALLKRQKKEIEELRAKLLDSHSEHLEEEILSLRNALLKAELERERMALELEEEKKAQGERERRLQEQAKKIENLSSMVLCSNKNENHDIYKKEKRRETWCPGKLSRETTYELNSKDEEKSLVKPGRVECFSGPLLPFEELDEAGAVESCKEEEHNKNDLQEDFIFPNPLALLHVTSRRKLPTRKKSLPIENSELEEIQAEYEDLLIKFETERIMSEIQLDYLRSRLVEADLSQEEKFKESFAENMTCKAHGCASDKLSESEAILVIKQLQEKITVLEMEKSSSQQNLDCVIELATEQTISAKEKYDELYAELQDAQKEVKLANEQLNLMPSRRVDSFDSFTKPLIDIQELVLEIENSRDNVQFVSSDFDAAFKYLSAVTDLLADLRTLALQTSLDMKTIFRDYKKLKSYLEIKVDRLEIEKIILSNQSLDLQNQIAELNSNAQISAIALLEISKQNEAEKSELLSQIQVLQKEISCLSSSSLTREKESMRKDLVKTNAKLRDTESKLKNAIQEKTKLEGEKACAERENKLLRGQKAILERDISKHDSVVGKKRDSIIDRSSNLFDPKRGRGLAIAVEQEEYKRLEVLAFEMETTIASLEEELQVTRGEKEEAILKAESLASELHALLEELNMTNVELAALKEEVTCLESSLEEYKSQNQNLKGSVDMMIQEKEELTMQLTDALLLTEEGKAMWSAKEKASIVAIEEKSRLYNAEIALLLNEMSAVKKELDFSSKQCKFIEDRLTLSEKDLELEKKYSAEKSLEIDKLKEDLLTSDDQSKRTQETLSLQLEKLQMELVKLRKQKEDLLAQLGEFDARSLPSKELQVEELSGRLSSLEAKINKDEVINKKEKAKLRMRLRYTQLKLDVCRTRHKEALDELDLMNKKYEAASTKLKNQLASYGIEVLNLKKQLAAVKEH